MAFLRGINLGKRRLPMAELKRHFEALDFAEVATFIASGNVVFTTGARDPARLEARIEAHLAMALGYSVDTFVRRDEEVAAVLATKPFADGVPENGGVYVSFLKQPLSEALAGGLVACATPADRFCLIGRELYWRRVGGVADAEIWHSPAVRALKLPTMTMRNMTSLRKLAEKFGFSRC
ncbi:MAG: DUF1697 domain-containing protein [Opitutaceae bacterium]|nr:DUF1697 domain-containing protein [Opitutaceae bacterium]